MDPVRWRPPARGLSAQHLASQRTPGRFVTPLACPQTPTAQMWLRIEYRDRHQMLSIPTRSNMLLYTSLEDFQLNRDLIVRRRYGLHACEVNLGGAHTCLYAHSRKR